MDSSRSTSGEVSFLEYKVKRPQEFSISKDRFIVWLTPSLIQYNFLPIDNIDTLLG